MKPFIVPSVEYPLGLQELLIQLSKLEHIQTDDNGVLTLQSLGEEGTRHYLCTTCFPEAMNPDQRARYLFFEDGAARQVVKNESREFRTWFDGVEHLLQFLRKTLFLLGSEKASNDAYLLYCEALMATPLPAPAASPEPVDMPQYPIG
jgi:hypothetical protein